MISPLLANIYLHEVLDTWFEQQVKPRLRGQAFLIRYADDFVMVFARERDARRVLEVLPKRFARVRSEPPSGEDAAGADSGRPPGRPAGNAPAGRRTAGTFDLLGFTHYLEGRPGKGAG